MTLSSERTALAHHWLVAVRGGEKVLGALAELLPSADVFTLVQDASQTAAILGSREVRSSFLQRMPGAPRWHRYFLPLYPLAARSLDLRGYDLVVTSDAATIKGVRVDRSAAHICYCHSPMRYVWGETDRRYRAAPRHQRWALAAVRRPLQLWDYRAAQGVTQFVANSMNVQRRIRECYGRDSEVVYPPVDVDSYRPDPSARCEGYFLTASHLVPYKRIDIVVDAFNRCGLPLLVVGSGPERARIERTARSNVRFLGAQPLQALVRLMQRCRAFVFAGEEDFGIVMAEAQACGKPVVALGRGGAGEIVTHGRTGVLFGEETSEGVLAGLEALHRGSFDPAEARESALRFRRERFLERFGELIAQARPRPRASAS